MAIFKNMGVIFKFLRSYYDKINNYNIDIHVIINSSHLLRGNNIFIKYNAEFSYPFLLK